MTVEDHEKNDYELGLKQAREMYGAVSRELYDPPKTAFHCGWNQGLRQMVAERRHAAERLELIGLASREHQANIAAEMKRYLAELDLIDRVCGMRTREGSS